MDDPLWESTFTGLFTEEAFPLPFYPIRGNHDMRSANPDAQLEYYQKHGDAGRWVFPSPYYALSQSLVDGTTMDLVFLDTLLLAPEQAEDEARVHLPVDEPAVRARQYAWLETTLAASRADWLLVFGHYPVWSCGEHGDSPSLIRDLLPLLEKYHVDAYYSGHDHSLQHLQHHGHVQFFVNGNGAKMGTVGNVTQAAKVKHAEVRQGFMSHEVSRKEMRTRAIDSKGRTVFEYTQKPRRLAALEAEAAALEAEDGPSPLVAVPVLKHKHHVTEDVPAKADLPTSMRGSGVRRKHLLLGGISSSSSSSSSSSNGDKGHGRAGFLALVGFVGAAMLVVAGVLYQRLSSSSSSLASSLPRHMRRRSYLHLLVARAHPEPEEEGEEEEEEGPTTTTTPGRPRQLDEGKEEEEEENDVEMAHL